MPRVKGAEIRARRQRLGIKLGPFAAKAGVGYKTLANIECGSQRFASIELVNLLAMALGDGTKAGDLLDTEEAPEPEGAAA